MTEGVSTLLSLLGVSLGNKPAVLSNDVDWPEVLKAAGEQNVYSLASDALEQLPEESRPPREVLFDWIGRTLYEEKIIRKQWEAAKELGEICRKTGFRVFVLKGFPISDLYPHPDHRLSEDIDVFCVNSDGYCCGDALDDLMEGSGIHVNRAHYKHSEFCFKGLTVENHRHILPIRGSRKVKEFDRWLLSYIDGGTSCIRGSYLEKPSDIFSAVFLLAHSQEHFLGWNINLRHICDWAMLMKRLSSDPEGVDWQMWKCVCGRYGLLRFGYAMTRLAGRICDFDVPFECPRDDESDAKILEDICNVKAHKATDPHSNRVELFLNIFRDRWKFRRFSDTTAAGFAFRRVSGFLFDLQKASLSIVLLLLVPLFADAQEVQETAEDNTFGGWNFVEVDYNIPKAKMYVMAYFEVENYQFQRLDCLFGRFAVGCKPLKWLKFSLNYVPCYVPGLWLHFLEGEITGTLKSGNFSVSLRERYRHGFTNSSDELRSRLKVAYRIGESKFTPYLAVELQTWSKWLKTRHYVACTYDILDFMQLEWYYMYYLMKNSPAEHVIGLGFNFNF